MAFDRPLEADRVDDLNLLSSFVRGPIMWALGGLLSDDKENAMNKKTLEEDLFVSGTIAASNSSSTEDIQSCVSGQESDLEESINRSPGLLRRSSTNFQTDARIRSESLSRDEQELSPATLQRKKTRKMSWSDESGQDLVQYYDEVSHISLILSLQKRELYCQHCIALLSRYYYCNVEPAGLANMLNV